MCVTEYLVIQNLFAQPWACIVHTHGKQVVTGIKEKDIIRIELIYTTYPLSSGHRCSFSKLERTGNNNLDPGHACHIRCSHLSEFNEKCIRINVLYMGCSHFGDIHIDSLLQ